MKTLFVLYFIIAIFFGGLGIYQGSNNKTAWGMLVFAGLAVLSPVVAWCLLT